MNKRLIFLLLFSTSLLAHKVNLFITHEDNNVEIYSYFASGDACKGCKLMIKHGNDTPLVNAHLNEEGKYQFISSYASLNITVDASSGHLISKDIVLDLLPQENLTEVLKKEKHNQYLNMGL
ncbi:MAG: hypothetical protein PHS65_04910, partial [Arcobacteraceae bacterium]|nr:hypothetical protein [Arcobacteraceae bacterium]